MDKLAWDAWRKGAKGERTQLASEAYGKEEGRNLALDA